MKHLIKAAILASAAVLLTTSAFATNKTATFNVLVTVNPSCEIAATDLVFGAYDPLGVNKAAALTGQTTIHVQCLNEMAATVSLDEGLYKATSSTPAIPLRRMQCADHDQEFLSYALFTDSLHATVWGSLASNLAIVGDGTNQSIPVYGTVAAGQIAEDGTYSDTVTATVSY